MAYLVEVIAYNLVPMASTAACLSVSTLIQAFVKKWITKGAEVTYYEWSLGFCVAQNLLTLSKFNVDVVQRRTGCWRFLFFVGSLARESRRLHCLLLNICIFEFAQRHFACHRTLCHSSNRQTLVSTSAFLTITSTTDSLIPYWWILVGWTWAWISNGGRLVKDSPLRAHMRMLPRRMHCCSY